MSRPRTTAGPLRLIYPAEYASWCAMLSRCYQPTNGSYARYGGAGIRVCVRWHTFANFLDDMGPRPTGLTIERIRNGEGYHADNCRWATKKEQARNRWDNRVVKLDGRSQCLIEWCEELGLPQATIRMRLTRGWSARKALLTPIRGSGSSSSAAGRPASSPPRTLHGAGSKASEVQAWLVGADSPTA